MKKRQGFYLVKIILIPLLIAVFSAQQVRADEEAIFTSSTAPDALIVLDLSGSMAWNPAGGSNTYGISSCAASTTYCTGTGCSGGYCSSSKTNCSTVCSRLAIAKRVIFDVLDDDNNSTINSADETSLGIRMGYMRYYSCSASSEEQTGTYSYSSGCNKVSKTIGLHYSQIFCNNSTSCTSSTSSGTSAPDYVNGAGADGGTPLAISLYEAKLYLDYTKTVDTAASCRKKFAIVLTDGADTYACSGDGSECSSGRYKNRRDVVARAKALADAGYKTFVIGFGASMPDYLENTLNWMAYYGGTDNPNTANAGSTSAFTPGTAGACTASSLYTPDPTCYDSSGSHTTPGFRAISNDPGYLSLSGYAFLAADATALATAMKTAIDIIRQANYSFSQSSVQSYRATYENYLYEGSFEPATDDTEPFWTGHLKKYQIDSTTGNVGSVLWDAGTVLQSTAASSRTIMTYKGGNLIHFSTPTFAVPTPTSTKNYQMRAFDSSDTGTYITAADLGTTTADAVVGYIRGAASIGTTVYNPDLPDTNGIWKLGDVFRSTPITVGSPSDYFNDTRDCKNQFAAHRTNHVRSSANGKRLITVGANDGQVHAFIAQNGSEPWSFIPPNLLTKLSNVTHASHPANETHQFFIDGPITVADVWNGTSATGCTTACSASGKCKQDDSWRTILVFGEGRGATSHGWSSSASCDSGISSKYSVTDSTGNTTTYPYYCGYHALDVTDSLNPTYLWHLNFTDTANQAPYLGDPWSKMMTGRVLYNDGTNVVEKWVGFIGGGYNANNCTSGTCDTRGKGFYIVDLSGTGTTGGKILWSYTYGTSNAMAYSVPAAPAIVDTDSDGFIDTVYVGDMGGNVWRFTLCRNQDLSTCGISGQTTNWSGGKFFDATSGSGNTRPIFTTLSAAKDTGGHLWVYWGTGDKLNPTDATTQDYFYGVKDARSSTTVTASNVTTLPSTGSTTYDSTSSAVGYRIQLSTGEKVLADSTIFSNVAYFTSYVPSSTSSVCNQSGTAYLYAINYLTGGGALSGSARSMSIGSGIPSAPVVSLAAGSTTPSIYVTTSGGGGTSASTQRVDITPSSSASTTNMLYWRDMRIQ